MAKKFYTVEKEINGKKYIAQFNGISAAVEAIDDCYVDGTISMTKISKYIFENVIVEPKGLTADDFDTLDEFSDVINWGREVMQGDFREKKDEGGSKKKG